MSILISPSILSADFAKLESEIRDVERCGADWLHLDVMDGVFVPNLTFGPVIVDAINRLSDLPLDVHLMIVDPARYVDRFVKAGADWITFHIEAEKDVEGTIELIRSHGAKAGISVSPPTPIELIEPYLTRIDLVLVMSVNPGFSGQKFMPEVLPKVRWLVEMREKTGARYLISIDGGINDRTAPMAVDAGVDVLVSASYIFGSADRCEAIRKLASLK